MKHLKGDASYISLRTSALTSVSSSVAYPASYPMGTGVLSPGAKLGLVVTLTTRPHIVPRTMSGSYASPSWSLHGVAGHIYSSFTPDAQWPADCRIIVGPLSPRLVSHVSRPRSQTVPIFVPGGNPTLCGAGLMTDNLEADKMFGVF
jgi:hypothetical protein